MTTLTKLRRAACCALLTFTLATSYVLAAAEAPQGEGRTHALLLGLNYDQDAMMSPYRLNYSQNDVHAVKKMLTSYCGVQEADIEILTDADRPDARAVRRKLAEIAARAESGDRILFFYSGHGVTRQGAWAMVPYNFNRDDIDGTLLWNTDITRIMEDSQADEMIFIADSCYSGSSKSLPPSFMAKNPDYGSKYPLFGDGTEEFVELRLGGGWDFPERQAVGGKSIGERKKIVRLCSSSVGEISREYLPVKMGAFTYAMTQSVGDWWSKTISGELTIGKVHRLIVPLVKNTGFHTPFISENGYSVILTAKAGHVKHTDYYAGNVPVSTIHQAALSGDRAAIQRLIASGADVNVLDQTGWSALHYTSEPSITAMLIANGANPNSQSGAGYSPLHVAAMFERPDIIDELIKHGANPATKDRWGRDPLYYALTNRSEGAIALLIRINRKN